MDEGGGDAAVIHPGQHWTRTRLRWRWRRSGTIPAASRSWVPMTFSSNLRMAAPGRGRVESLYPDENQQSYCSLGSCIRSLRDTAAYAATVYCAMIGGERLFTR